jgi:organic radical activating enzyme
MESQIKLRQYTSHLKYLDVNIQYACNLSCVGCISLSDFNRKGGVRINEGVDWLREWSKKLTVDTLCLFGGEPLLNPDFGSWVNAARYYFPKTHIKVITNGFYLRSDHVNFLSNVKNSTLQISFHFQNKDKSLLKIIKDATKHLYWNVSKATEEIIFLKFVNDNLNIQCARFGEFRKPYKNNKNKMMPWESTDLQGSINNCGSPRNPILYKNKLWKCAPIANLRDTLNTLKSYDKVAWKPYLDYEGCGLEDDIEPFINDFGKPNKICSMCCSTKDSEIDHFSSGMVRNKKK